MHANQNKHLEIEVKFHLIDPEPLRSRLIDLGAVSQPRVFETNRRYEDKDHRLMKTGKLLRLRRDRTWRLTFKSRADRHDPEFKIYRELEISLEDGDTMDAILTALGFQTVQIYEKYREVFHWRNVMVCIDTMPFGTFLEIEGEKADIVATAKALGLKWQQRILTNYLALFDVLRRKEKLEFQDVTFKNFTGHPVDITPYIDQFYPAPNSNSD